MKISEKDLRELRHLIPKLGKLLDSHINVQLNLTYYTHSNEYAETAELWIAAEETLLDFTVSQALINHIWSKLKNSSLKTRIICNKQEKEESDA